jgi:opacity protein-like surface antigen
MKMRRILTALAAGILFAATPAASAELYKGLWEVSVMGGGGSGDANGEVGTGAGLGVRAAYFFSSKLMLELMVEQFGTDQKVNGFLPTPQQAAEGNDPEGVTDTRFLYYALALTANFRSETEGARVIPYITVGLGAAVQERDEYKGCQQYPRSALNAGTDPNVIFVTCGDIDWDREVAKDAPGTNFEPAVYQSGRYVDGDFGFPEDAKRTDTGTMLSAGFGTRWFVTPTIGVRGELRYYHFDTFDLNQDAFGFDVGVTFLLGSRN